MITMEMQVVLRRLVHPALRMVQQRVLLQAEEVMTPKLAMPQEKAIQTRGYRLLVVQMLNTTSTTQAQGRVTTTS